MKTKKVKVRQGFTIVELVIVIGVIGVLTAVLIPTFINLNKKAEMASQQSFLKNVNTQLAMRKAEGAKLETMHDAMEIADEMGFDVEKISPIDGNDIVYDMKANRFAMMKGEEVTYSEGGLQGQGTEIWKIADSAQKAAAINNAGHSIYAKATWNIGNLAEIKVGFDAGNNFTANFVSYINSGAAQKVVIRTNSANTNLSINAPLATVHHYDSVGKVTIDRIDMNCYYEKGNAAYVKITEGKAVAKDGGKISVAFADNLDGTKVAITEEAGKVETGYTVVQPVSTANQARDGGIALTYSIDGEHAASATAEQIAAAKTTIESTGALSVASETGVQPAGMDFTAVVNNVGYNSLQEAIDAAGNGNTVSLLKDYNTSTERILVNKPLTINGNNHIINNTRAQSAFAPINTRSGRDAAIYVTSNVTFNKLTLKTTQSCFLHVPDNSENLSININDCDFEAPGNKYGFVVGNKSNNIDVKINNSTLTGWCSLYIKGHHSSFLIENSMLCGVNGTSVSPSNGFGTIVVDTNDGFTDQTITPETEGCYNNIVIKNTDIYANTDTAAGANVEVWLCLQYRAHHNTVTVTGGNIFSTNPITPEAGWEYHHAASGNDDDLQATNTVTVNGVQYFGFPSNHD